MNLSDLKHRATYTPTKGWIRKHSKNPSDQNIAVRAALQVARRDDTTTVVIRSNSHGQPVYRIAYTSDSIGKYCPGAWPCPVLVVRHTGEIFLATADDWK
jgi:hypothetical protein